MIRRCRPAAAAFTFAVALIASGAGIAHAADDPDLAAIRKLTDQRRLAAAESLATAGVAWAEKASPTDSLRLAQ